MREHEGFMKIKLLHHSFFSYRFLQILLKKFKLFFKYIVSMIF